VLLQKTLLNIEGLGCNSTRNSTCGRPPNPGWKLDERTDRWRGFLKSLREEAPRYATLLPQLPRLLHRHLETSHQTSLHDVTLHKELERQKKINFRLSVAIAVCWGCWPGKRCAVGL